MVLFSEIADKKCIKDRYPALDSDCVAMSAVVEFVLVLLV